MNWIRSISNEIYGTLMSVPPWPAQLYKERSELEVLDAEAKFCALPAPRRPRNVAGCRTRALPIAPRRRVRSRRNQPPPAPAPGCPSSCRKPTIGAAFRGGVRSGRVRPIKAAAQAQLRDASPSSAPQGDQAR
jgi:hypothetical protein